jgi:hypothetical protein
MDQHITPPWQEWIRGMPHGTHRDRGHVNDLSTPRTLDSTQVVRFSHLEKYEFVNGVGKRSLIYEMGNNKCLKPPTRLYSMHVTIQFVSSIICMYI